MANARMIPLTVLHGSRWRGLARSGIRGAHAACLAAAAAYVTACAGNGSSSGDAGQGGTSSRGGNTLDTGGANAQAGSSAVPCSTGSVGCACYGNETCNGSLTCASHLCVDLASFGAGGALSRAENGGAGTPCPIGSEGCACYSNDTCDGRLTCASHLCVDLGSAGGAPGLGGGPTAGASSFGGAPGAGAGGTAPSGGGQGGLTGGIGGCVPGPTGVQIVVDTSSSMNGAAPNTSTGVSKWQVTRDALIDAIASMPATMSAGIAFYPNQATSPNPNGPALPDPPPCVDTTDNVAIDLLGPPASTHRATVDATLHGLVIPPTNAGTPTHDGYVVALTPLRQASFPADRKFMLLITDGQPTFSRGCVGWGAAQYPVDPAPIVQEIRNAYDNDGVRTFIIGAPGSEKNPATGVDVRAWLSDAAVAGGTAVPGCSSNGPDYCHFDLSVASDFGLGLAVALRIIVGNLACGIAPALVCPTGMQDCGSGCVDLSNNMNHCGICSKACSASANQACIAGTCRCPDTMSDCAGLCVALQSDALNCGACGRSCSVGAGVAMICSAGVCAPP